MVLTIRVGCSGPDMVQEVGVLLGIPKVLWRGVMDGLCRGLTKADTPTIGGIMGTGEMTPSECVGFLLMIPSHSRRSFL